jgi:hypothetical protein
MLTPILSASDFFRLLVSIAALAALGCFARCLIRSRLE